MRVGFFEAAPGTYYHSRRIDTRTQEIEIITDGVGTFVWEGNEYVASPGSSVWFCPGDLIVVTADVAAPYKTCVLRFDMARMPEKRPPFLSTWSSVSSCREFCQSLLSRYRLTESVPLDLAECIYARLHWEADESLRRQAQAVAPAVQRALSYIEAHYVEPLSIPDIADSAGVSPPHLHALFRQHAGISPKQAILKLRIQKAEGLLLRSALSIKEISSESGFGDVSSFCAYFRRVMGMAPGQYRQQRGLGKMR